jgi:hypothetical protein
LSASIFLDSFELEFSDAQSFTALWSQSGLPRFCRYLPDPHTDKNQGFHYNQNAETYMLVGEALGKGMLKLLGGEE